MDLILKIDDIISNLDCNDVEAHIWWNKFRNFLLNEEEYSNENYTDHPDYLISQDALYNNKTTQ